MFNLIPQERNVALFLVVTLAVGSGVLFFKKRSFHQIKPELVKAEFNKKAKIDAKEEIVVVHLAGAVFKPGLYRVKKDTRVGEVLNETNLKVQADISNINLARTIRDGEKIFIPLKSTAIPLKSVPAQKNLENFSSSITINSQGHFININQADVTRLSKLPGIGEILSQRIIEYRKEFGLFQSKEDIKNVRGIGEGRFEKIKDKISVN